MRLTDKFIKTLPLPARGNKITYDTEVKGFGLRATAAGAKSFVLNYRRRADGLERRYTIGAYPEWTTSVARGEAKRLKRDIGVGADPVGAHQDARGAATIDDLCDRFIAEHLPRKRPLTQISYQQQIAADIRPALGRMKVAAVTFADVDAWHRKLSARAPTHANRALALLSRMFTLAIKWGLRTDNPCRGVERNPENQRQRYLTGAEMVRLTAALDELSDQGAADAIRLLLLTGARRGELLAARWSDLDLDAGVWTKPAVTTKQGAVHRVPLSDAARKLLADMREQAPADAEWLFPSPIKPGSRTDLKVAWEILRAAADIRDVRLHDCRHSFASVLASQGLSLPIIGALLGHSTPHTTARYAHLLDDPLRAATERASAIITGAKSAEVVSLPDRRHG
jgi:integrase